MWGSLLLVMLGATMTADGDLESVRDSLEDAIPAANRVDAGIFAPELYQRAIRTLHEDEPGEAYGATEEMVIGDLRDALRLFRRAEEVARGERLAIVRNARLRYEAVRAFAEEADTRRYGGEGYRISLDLATRAESVAADPPAARLLWEEAIDSLNSSMWQAEQARAALVGGAPTVPYVAYDACPFEGCCYRTWFARQDLIAYARPDSAADIAFRIGSGEPVLAVMGVLIVSKLGYCIRDPRFPDEENRDPDEPVILLGYEGEGLYRAFCRGAITIVQCDWDTEGGEPEFVWWAMVQARDGRIGWVADPASEEEQLFDNQSGIDFSYAEEPCER